MSVTQGWGVPAGAYFSSWQGAEGGLNVVTAGPCRLPLHGVVIVQFLYSGPRAGQGVSIDDILVERYHVAGVEMAWAACRACSLSTLAC